MIPQTVSFIRLAATIFYDALLLTAVLFFATFMLLLIPEEIRNTNPVVQILKVLWYLLVSYIYFVGFWLKGGQTPGMKAWKIKLVNTQGGAPSTKQATIRFFAAILSWALAGAGFLWMIVDRNHLSLHDHLSGSRLLLLMKSWVFSFLCWRTAEVVCPDRACRYIFIYCASALTCFSPFIGETLFFEWPKKRVQKKSHTAVLAFGCSVRFSVERALRNSLRSDSPRSHPLQASSARQHKRQVRSKSKSRHPR